MSNELAVLENLNAVEVFVAGGTDKLLQAIRDEVINIIPDLTTKKGRDEIASRAAKVSKSKVFIIKKADVLKAELKAQLKPITLETTKVENVLSALRKEVRLPLTQWEDAEKERIIRLKERLMLFEYSFEKFSDTSIDDMIKILDCATIIELNDTWEEFKGDAEIAKPIFIERLTDHLNELKVKESDRLKLVQFEKAEAERKQKEREEQIAKNAAAEAEAKTKAVAAKAAQDLIDAGLKAEADKKAAVQAEQDKTAELERQKLVVIAEVDAAAAKKSANVAHQKKINRAALADFGKIGIDDATSKKIIEAIARKKISFITINY